MTHEDKALFQKLLDEREPDEDLTKSESRRLARKTVRVRADNIFTWHLNRYTVFEKETDPALVRNGLLLRRVGTKDGARLSESEIASHEERLGLRLPEPWRSVYRHFNGGWSNDLLWGDLDHPRRTDLRPIPQLGHEYLALEDVAPLREIMAKEMEGFGWQALDPRLIAIACADNEAVILDYRNGDDPRVCYAYFDDYLESCLPDGWEQHELSRWFPNMRVFFHGLYLQDRVR